MQNNRSDDQREHQFRRSVSLDPRMASPERSQTAIHVNPMFEQQNDGPVEEKSSSLRRQMSEPARNRNTVFPNPRLTNRTESFKATFIRGTQQVLGITEDNDSEDEIWRQRRRRLIGTYGKLKQTEPAIQMRTRLPTEATGLDETDSDFQTNRMTGISETERQYMAETSPEDMSRRPAFSIALKAIASFASNTLKKRRISNQNDQHFQRDTKSDETADQFQSVTRDEVFPSDQEFPNECEENFFVLPAQPPPELPQEEEEVDNNRKRGRPEMPNKWSIQRQVSVKAKSIPEKLIQTLMNTDNSNRREFGLGLIDRALDRKLKKDLTKEERKAIDHFDDFRPFFTYWITTVQILVFIITISTYGFGYWGFGFQQIKGLVYVKSLSLQQVDYFEQQNFWGGPRSADLIHLGAKFTPCMRRDERVYQIIDEERAREANTGCCIRNDGSGCVQTFKHQCSPLLSTWHKWGPTDERSSGPVCGQDPHFCKQPASIEPYEWADNITKWPICRQKAADLSYFEAHMRCELIARPCCLGVYGQCYITTREYCNFIKGFFHEEATLCSQVSCMENVCGMVPFFTKDSPNQSYLRVFTPIFLHAGLGHLVITVLFHYFIMRDLEKMVGVRRMAAIYLLSGIGGYLASAVFLPFRPEVGPGPSLYALLACLFVELINMWDVIELPILVLVKLIGVATFLFLLGFLPWIDNYAHILGFIIGFLLSMAFMPNVTPNSMKKKHKIIVKSCCLGFVIFIITGLFVMLYEVPIYDIAFFKYLNCIPFTPDWCANQDIQINTVEILQ